MTDVNVQLFGPLMANSVMASDAGKKSQLENLRLPEFGRALSDAKNNRVEASTIADDGKTLEKTINHDLKKEDQGTIVQEDGKARIEKKLQIAEEQPAEMEVDVEDAKEVLEQISTMICQMVSDKLNVSLEDINMALEELNLTVTDLMESSNLAALFDFFLEDNQLIDVLMNEDFQDVMNEITGLVNELASRLDVDSKQVKDLITQIEAVVLEEQEEVSFKEDIFVLEEEQRNVEEVTGPVVEEKQTVEVAKENPVTPVIVTEDEDASVENKILEEKVENVQTTVQTTSQMEDTSKGETDDSQNEEDLTKELFVKRPEKEVVEHESVTTTRINTQTVVTPEGTTAVEHSVKVVDLQNLVSEITEYISLRSAQGEISSIEMQLNPEKLGRVLVEVVTNQGEVTAKIATQTIAAKEAMEANVAQLKENLEQQGVKVNAIEVTVESHGFEENLQEDGSKEQQQLAKEMQQQNRRMNLNLNEMSLDDLQGLMSEEDMVVAKIMRDQGNVLNIGV